MHMSRQRWGVGGGEGVLISCIAVVLGHGPLHAYNAGTEHVGVSTDQAHIACTKRDAP